MWLGLAVTECKKDHSCVFELGKKGNGDNRGIVESWKSQGSKISNTWVAGIDFVF